MTQNEFLNTNLPNRIFIFLSSAECFHRNKLIAVFGRTSFFSYAVATTAKIDLFDFNISKFE